MKYAILLMAGVLLAGCASPSKSDRAEGPVKTLTSEKTGADVAQCIQVSWQNTGLFGDTADVFLDRLDNGGFTVFTTRTTYFADVLRQGGGSEVKVYANKDAKQTPLRVAAVASCL